MENKSDYTPEELEKALEKAKKEAQALLENMTPQEREEAQRKAQKLIEDDSASMQKLLDDARSVLGSSAEKEAPKFCVNCGAAVGEGKFCPFCGKPL